MHVVVEDEAAKHRDLGQAEDCLSVLGHGPLSSSRCCRPWPPPRPRGRWRRSYRRARAIPLASSALRPGVAADVNRVLLDCVSWSSRASLQGALPVAPSSWTSDAAPNRACPRDALKSLPRAYHFHIEFAEKSLVNRHIHSLLGSDVLKREVSFAFYSPLVKSHQQALRTVWMPQPERKVRVATTSFSETVALQF